MVKVPPDRLLGSRCRLLSLRAAQCALYAHAPGMDGPLHDVRCSMGHEGALRLGASPRMRSDVQFAACAGMRMPQTSILPRHHTKDGRLPHTRLSISVAVFESKPTPHKKTEASRTHRPLARSLCLPRVAQGRHDRMTTPHAALAPQYNKSRERQLSQLSLQWIAANSTAPTSSSGLAISTLGICSSKMSRPKNLPQVTPTHGMFAAWAACKS